MSLTDQRITEIRARLAAVPGCETWLQDPDEPRHILRPDKPGSTWDGMVIATLQEDDFGLIEESNGSLIANAPADIAALLSENERLREQIAAEIKYAASRLVREVPYWDGYAAGMNIAAWIARGGAQ